jgi:hypothetical protein
MRPTSTSVTVAIATAALLGGMFLGRTPGIPSAMAQSGACCPTPAPVISVLQDGPTFTVQDPAKGNTPSSALAAVCATPTFATSGYSTLVVHLSSCTTPVYIEYALGQAGFVTQEQLPCTSTSSTAGARGGAIEVDARLGTTARLVTAQEAKAGGCSNALKVTVAGAR